MFIKKKRLSVKRQTSLMRHAAIELQRSQLIAKKQTITYFFLKNKYISPIFNA